MSVSASHFVSPSRRITSVWTSLWTDAAQSAFYCIFDNDGRPDLINNILQQLNFHPLSITLLTTVAHQNEWDSNRLAREWDECQTDMFQTEHNKSLATAIELSLASPCSKNLAPTPEDFSESWPSSRKVSTRTNSTGCFPPSQT